MRTTSGPPAPHGGFSLIELAVAIAVIGIIAGGAIQLATKVSRSQQIEMTRQRLKAVEGALVRYAARNGRLPCPNDASTPTDNATEPQDGDCAIGNTDVGVPWQDLDIARSDTLDGWNRQISYVVADGSDGIVRRNGLKLAATVICEEAPGDDNSGNCIDPAHQMSSAEANSVVQDTDKIDFVQHLDDWLQDKGLTVEDDDGNDMYAPGNGNGAAFVLVSHGTNGYGAFTRTGTEIPSAPNEGDGEAENQNGDATFVDAQRNEAEGDAHFDDMVRAISIHELARKAGRTPLAGS